MAERRYNILTPTNHGTMIVNRFDRRLGFHLSVYGAWDHTVVNLLRSLAQELMARSAGPIVAADVGANFGAITLPLARVLEERGEVHAFEPQRLVYYALCGSVALQSLENVHCHHMAVGDEIGQVLLPNYQLDKMVNIGAFKVDPSFTNEFDGQPTGTSEIVEIVTLDAFGLSRLDLLKIDVEGMEPRVLQGATGLIERDRPAILFEAWKGPDDALKHFFWQRDYRLFAYGDDTLALPRGKFALQPKGPELLP